MTTKIEPITKEEFPEIIYKILQENGGKMKLIDVSKEIWKKYEDRLHQSDMFYEWQYQFIWGATQLRKENRMKGHKACIRGIWELENIF